MEVIGTRVAGCRLMYFGSMARCQLAHGCPIKGLLVTAVGARMERLIIVNILILIWNINSLFSLYNELIFY